MLPNKDNDLRIKFKSNLKYFLSIFFSILSLQTYANDNAIGRYISAKSTLTVAGTNYETESLNQSNLVKPIRSENNNTNNSLLLPSRQSILFKTNSRRRWKLPICIYGLHCFAGTVH
jgi:hypothetical protein